MAVKFHQDAARLGLQTVGLAFLGRKGSARSKPEIEFSRRDTGFDPGSSSFNKIATIPQPCEKTFIA
jgi:hypothetical protein